MNSILAVLAFCLLIALVCLFFFKGRSKAEKKGKQGEALVKKAIKAMHLEALHDVILPAQDGMTQVDHIVKVGNAIVVVETKNYSGSIYGKQWDKEWRQVFRKGKSIPFRNPILQNYGHVKAVQAAVGDDVDVRGVVLFVGSARFPKGRLDDVLVPAEFPDWLRRTFVDAGAMTTVDRAWATLGDRAGTLGGRSDRKLHRETVAKAKASRTGA